MLNSFAHSALVHVLALSMSGNSFGTLFCVTSFGESHGPAYGGVVDGCPPGLEPRWRSTTRS